MRCEVQIARFWLNSCRVSQSLGSCAVIRSEALVTRMTPLEVGPCARSDQTCTRLRLLYLLNKFYKQRAELPHCLSMEQHNLRSLEKCKYIFFTSDGLKFSVWWVTLTSKPLPRVGNFELKSYPKGEEVWLQIFVSDLSPHPIPWTPPGHNIDSCINHTPIFHDWRLSSVYV